MSHQVPWSRAILDRFYEKAVLSEEEKFILETRAKNWSVSKQASALNMSESSVAKRIALLKKKYDAVQKDDDFLPPRKMSAKETWMDSH